MVGGSTIANAPNLIGLTEEQMRPRSQSRLQLALSRSLFHEEAEGSNDHLVAHLVYDEHGISDTNEWTRVLTHVGVRGQLVGIGHAMLVLEAQRLQALDVAFAAASVYVHLVAFDLAFPPVHHLAAFQSDAASDPLGGPVPRPVSGATRATRATRISRRDSTDLKVFI